MSLLPCVRAKKLAELFSLGKPISVNTDPKGELYSLHRKEASENKYQIRLLSKPKDNVLEVYLEEPPEYILPMKSGFRILAYKIWYQIDENGKTSSHRYDDKRLFSGEVMQSTESDSVWIGYDDVDISSGVCNEKTSGCLRLSQSGEVELSLWNWAKTHRIHFIDHVYALNAFSSHEVWVYGYSAFELVHIKEDDLAGTYKDAPKFAEAFAVDENYALFAKQLDWLDDSLCDRVTLVDLKGAEKTTEFQVINERGEPLCFNIDENRKVFPLTKPVARFDKLYLFDHEGVYVLRIQDLLC